MSRQFKIWVRNAICSKRKYININRIGLSYFKGKQSRIINKSQNSVNNLINTHASLWIGMCWLGYQQINAWWNSWTNYFFVQLKSELYN